MKKNDSIKSKKNLITFLFKYQKPYLKLAFGAGILLLLFELLQLPTPLITRYLIDHVIPSGNFSLLHLFCGILLAVITIKQLSAYFMRILLIKFKSYVHLDLEKSMYLHIQELPMDFFHKNPPGYLMSRISELSSAETLMADTFLSIIKDILTLIVCVTAILYLNFKIGLMALAALPFFIYSIKHFHKKLKLSNRVVYEKTARYSSNLEKNLNAIEKIKTAVLEDKEGERLSNRLKDVVFSRINNEKLNTIAKLTASSIAIIPPFLVIYYGVMEIMKGHLTLGTFIAINAFITNLFGPAQNLTEIGYSFSRSFAGLERIHEIFTLPAEDNSGLTIPKIKDIEFKQVTFSYDNKTNVLKDLSFKIHPGEKVGIVGKSGMGKSTIVKMILKLLTCQQGEISISSTNITHIQRKNLRQKISYISQSLMILDADVKERQDNSEIRSILNRFKVNLEGKEFFKQELSGGEVQRLEIAEHLLRDADLLIIDEGTSNLDYESEREVLQALMQKYKDKTVIVIAHRLHSISEFQRLLVLENGQIQEEGSHEELINLNGIYRALWEKQNESLFADHTPFPSSDQITDPKILAIHGNM